MYVVIFEVIPWPQYQNDYLTLAAALRTEVSQIEGFISVERFKSIANEDKLVSLSFWRDEQAILNWKKHHDHQLAQQKGIQQYFKDFRIRVGKIERDYSLCDRQPGTLENNS